MPTNFSIIIPARYNSSRLPGKPLLLIKDKPLIQHIFETASSTEWQPPGSATTFHANWFVDISKTLAKTIKALQAYAIEMREWPHARSTKALEYLAHWRGANVGLEAAEAFILGRNRT